jgi:hypothetical protein
MNPPPARLAVADRWIPRPPESASASVPDHGCNEGLSFADITVASKRPLPVVLPEGAPCHNVVTRRTTPA